MDKADQKIEQLQDELKIIKNEIKETLVDIREHLLTYAENPFSVTSVHETAAVTRAIASIQAPQAMDAMTRAIAAIPAPQAMNANAAALLAPPPAAPTPAAPPPQITVSTSVATPPGAPAVSPSSTYGKESDRHAAPDPDDAESESDDAPNQNRRHDSRREETSAASPPHRRARANADEEDRGDSESMEGSGPGDDASPEPEQEDDGPSMPPTAREQPIGPAPFWAAEHDEGQTEQSPAADLLTIATLAAWLEESLERLGKDRVRSIVEIYSSMGGLQGQVKEILLQLINLSGAPATQPAPPMREHLRALAELDSLLWRSRQDPSGAAALSAFLSKPHVLRSGNGHGNELFR